eukprot:107987-Rhodomonas_salina.1
MFCFGQVDVPHADGHLVSVSIGDAVCVDGGDLVLVTKMIICSSGNAVSEGPGRVSESENETVKIVGPKLQLVSDVFQGPRESWDSADKIFASTSVV